jgi:hypothetical protein
MGGGSYSREAFTSFSTARGYDHKAPEEVINKTEVEKDFLPPNFKNGIREARDSADHPLSTPIIVAGDVTGSMGKLAGLLLKEGLNAFVEAIYARKPIPDPAIMGMAVGDVDFDQVPIQCTQFESDIRIIDSFSKLFVEQGGGGNSTESYSLPWIIAAGMCRTDAWEKRGEKGVLFTYGDEEAPKVMDGVSLKKFLGFQQASAGIDPQRALDLASNMYDCYHLIIEEGRHCRAFPDRVKSSWRNLMGENVILVSDHHKLAEIMVSIIEVRAGRSKDDVVGSWGTASGVVQHALASLPEARA